MYLSKFIFFCDIVTGIVDGGERTVDMIYLDLSKIFDTLPHDILNSKLRKESLNKIIVKWICNWLYHHVQRVVINGYMSKWEKLSSRDLQGSVLGLELFNILTNGLGDRIQWTTDKFLDNIKLNGVSMT